MCYKENFTTKCRKGIISIFLASFASVFLFSNFVSSETNPSPPYSDKVLYTDLIARYNPAGVMLFAGGHYRYVFAEDKKYNIPSSYIQSGLMLGINPAYAQSSIHLEWLPVVFASLRLQYDYYNFFGRYGGLLSFPSGNERFGDDVLNRRSGDEEKATGQRLIFQPLIRAKIGSVIVRNQSDIAYYYFNGRGPYFFEWEYDTLLKNMDTLLANRTHILFDAQQYAGGATLLVGPYYEITRGVDANITRQRAGMALFWQSKDSRWGIGAPRFYSQIGFNIEDRNRDNELFFIVGVGTDFTIF